MVMVNTQRPALEEVIPADDMQGMQFRPGSTYELVQDGEVSPLYFLGASQPWDGPYCDRNIWIAGFGFEPNGDKQPQPGIWYFATLIRSPTQEERQQYGRPNSGLVVVEGLRFVSVYHGTAIRFALNGMKTSYIPLV